MCSFATTKRTKQEANKPAIHIEPHLFVSLKFVLLLALQKSFFFKAFCHWRLYLPQSPPWLTLTRIDYITVLSANDAIDGFLEGRLRKGCTTYICLSLQLVCLTCSFSPLKFELQLRGSPGHQPAWSPPADQALANGIKRSTAGFYPRPAGDKGCGPPRLHKISSVTFTLCVISVCWSIDARQGKLLRVWVVGVTFFCVDFNLLASNRANLSPGLSSATLSTGLVPLET